MDDVSGYQGSGPVLSDLSSLPPHSSGEGISNSFSASEDPSGFLTGLS